MKVLIIRFLEIKKPKRIMSPEIFEEKQVTAQLNMISYIFLKCR